MRIIRYQKTERGPVVVQVLEIDPDKIPGTIARFESFFDGVPLHGGREWKMLSVEQIIAIFVQAASDLRQIYQDRRVHELQVHSGRSRFGQWWKELRGWKEPHVPSFQEIFQDMIARCNHLAEWMEENSTRPFYANSDMSCFIKKPRAVALELAKHKNL